MPDSDQTLLVFGMDGGVREYVEEAIDRGLMPNMERLTEGGSFGELQSVVPPVTIPAWPSMFSGLKPGKFPAFHMTEIDENHEVTSIPSERWKKYQLWNQIEGQFGLVNVPGTSPVYPVDGYMVEGFPMVMDPSCYPEDLVDLDRMNLRQKDGQTTREGRRRAFFHNFEERKKVFGDIDEKVDVRIEVFQLTDAAAHRSKNLDQILKAYSKVDEVLGQRMQEYDDILLVSDHGFMEVEKTFYVNSWLRDNGYLEPVEQNESDMLEDLRDILMPLASTRLRPVLGLLNDLASETMGVDLSPGGFDLDEINMQKSEAFSFRNGANNYGGIVINSGFKQSPVKEPKKTAEEIKEALSDEQVIEEVWLAEELYEQTRGMPDVIFRSREDVSVGTGLNQSQILDKRSFVHSDTGVVAAYGDSFKTGRIENAEIIDVAPTISYYLGQEFECDGEVLDVFRAGFEPRVPDPELSGIDI